MKAINVLLALVVSLLVAVLVFEGGLRLMGFGPQERLVDFHPNLGWAKKPNFEIDRSGKEYDITIRTNEYGLVDDSMESRRKPGAYRVLALGDSFTQGFSVERQDLFVDRLESWWEAEGRDIDVVNAGTEAYDTAQSVTWFLEEGRDFDPDLVLLFAYENDLYWNSQAVYTTPDGDREKPRFSATGEREKMGFDPPADSGWLSTTATGKVLGKLTGGPAATDQSFTAPTGKPAFKEFAPLLVEEPDFMADVRAHTRGALLALQQRCEEEGISAIVVPIPSRSVYDAGYRSTVSNLYLGGVGPDQWAPDKPVELFLELAGDVGLATLDPREALGEGAGGDLYFEHDWHLNPEGNAVFASYLHDELDRLGAVPATTQVAAMPEVPAREAGGAPFALKLYVGLLVFLSVLYISTYPQEPKWQPPLKIAVMLGVVFGLFIGVGKLQAALPPKISGLLAPVLLIGILGFVAYKLGNRLGTIAELMKAFALRGHWYLMPLVIVLLTIGSLLVVAASSPLVAPFIYTLF